MNDTGSLSRNIVVGELDEQSRGTFVSRTYGHLFGAVTAFTLIEVYFFRTGLAETIARALMGVSWLFVLGGFMVVSWLASRTAHLAQAKVTQYAALTAYVVAEAIIVVPLLYIADKVAPGYWCKNSYHRRERKSRRTDHSIRATEANNSSAAAT